MHRSHAILLTRLATAATGATLLLAGCDGGGTDDSGRYPHETGARCATEADSPDDCEAAEGLAEEVEALAGVASVEYEFRTIDGEGINELILSIDAAADSTADDLVAAIERGRSGVREVDPGRDTSVSVSRAGAGMYIDDEDVTDAAEAAEVLVAAGGLAEYGVVETSVAPAEIFVRMPPEATYADIGPAAGTVAELALDPTIHVVLSSGGSYLSGKDITDADARRWDNLVAAAGPGFATIALDGRDVSVSIDGPRHIRPSDFTFGAYGDRYLPMIEAHLDEVRALGDGASYAIDTNWEQNDGGFDTFLEAVAGPDEGDADARGWSQAAEAYLDR